MHVSEYVCKTCLKELGVLLKCRETFEDFLQPVTSSKCCTSTAQSAFTYSKLTIETREQGVKYVQSYQKHQNDVIGVVLVSLMLTLNIFRTLF